MTVPFLRIPADLKVPLFHLEFDPSRANPGLEAKRALLIGTGTTGTTGLRFHGGGADEAASVHGAGSDLARLVAAYREVDGFGELWTLSLAEAGGATAASGTIVLTGTATAAGVLSLYVAGTLVSLPVAVGSTAAALATAAAAAIAANPFLPVSAAAAAGTVTLTAKSKGTPGNALDLRLNYGGARAGESTPAGLTVAITAMSGGATDPDLSTLAATLGDEPFEFMAFPWRGTTQLDAMRGVMDDLTGRWSWERMIYGHAFTVARDTDANLLTLGAARNDPHVTIVGYESTSPSDPMAMLGNWLAQVSVSIRAHPARPLQTLPLPGTRAPIPGARWRKSVHQSLLSAGIAVPFWNADGTGAILRSVTTYQRNAWGVTDRSYLDCETLFLGAEIVRRLRSRITQRFPRHILASDGTRFGEGAPVITPRAAKGELVAHYAEMEAEALVEDAEGFAAATLVERDANDPSRLNILYAPNQTNGLRVFAVLNQFRS